MIRDVSPYLGYLYGYPHKTAYRRLDRPRSLAEAWAGEDTADLSLYLHVPMCEQRCGFCNLFTAAGAEDRTPAWLDAMERDAAAVREALPDARYARVAIGGGTPTILPAPALDRLLGIRDALGAAGMPTSVEASPATATDERLDVLVERRITRISVGIQSFDDREAAAVGRTQSAREVARALDAVRARPIPVLNVDLIYGIPGQTEASFLASLDAALAWAPDELYLYPLYVREMTGLGRRGMGPDDVHRLQLYRAGRDHLTARGYSQASMRCFRRGPPRGDFACQRDGMVGIGPGARSYTSGLHYSSEWAVSRGGVLRILDGWIRRDALLVDHGVELDRDEQRRRYVLLSVLTAEGMDLAAFRALFPEPSDLDRELADLVDQELAHDDGVRLTLTPDGLERSDAIGPMLISPGVRARMAAYVTG